MTGIFITATDTGIGKTAVAAALAKRLQFNRRVAVFKPVETGGTGPQDAVFLTKFSSLTAEDKGLSNVYHFRKPVTPMLASELEGKQIQIPKITGAYLKLESKYDFVVVEGVGGIASPVANDMDNTDIASALGLSVLVVSKAGLGAISQSVVAVKYAVSRGCSVAGVILNRVSRRPTLAEKTNPRIIQKVLGIPVFVLPEINARGSTLVTRMSNSFSDELLEIVQSKKL